MRESVVLPAPDGEDRTSIRPRRAIASFGAEGRGVGAAGFLLLAVFFRPAFRPVSFRPVLAAGVLAILKPPKCLRPRVADALSEHDLHFSGSCSIPDSAPARETARPPT